jgi:hypothetical protein
MECTASHSVWMVTIVVTIVYDLNPSTRSTRNMCIYDYYNDYYTDFIRNWCGIHLGLVAVNSTDPYALASQTQR